MTIVIDYGVSFIESFQFDLSSIICSYLADALSRNLKNKKNSLWNKFLYLLIFQKMELSGSNIRNFSYFLKRKLFLYFRKQKPTKKSLYFRKRNFFYISGNGNPEKRFIFQEVTLQALEGNKNHSNKISSISRKRTF